MANRTTIHLSEEAQRILENLQALPNTVPVAVAKAMHLENQYTISHIQREYLSFPKSSPPVEIGLRVQSNRLRSSVWSSQPEIGNDGTVTSAIGSNVEYAAIHEFGGTIEIGERKGTVRLRTDKQGELLRNEKGGAIFARADHKRAREVEYTAKAHEIEMPARAPFQRGIRDRLDDYGEAISQAVVEAMGG